MVALHLDYWHNQIKSQSHIFSPLFFAESVDFGIDNICVMCRSQIDFNSDLKSSFVKMSDLNLTIRFFPSQWRKTWILSSIKHEEMKTRGWWKSKITWSWIWIYDIENSINSCIELSPILCKNMSKSESKWHSQVNGRRSLYFYHSQWMIYQGTAIGLSWMISLWALSSVIV